MFGRKITINYNGLVDTKFEEDIQKLEFVNKSPNKDPYYEHEGDSGFDLRAWITADEQGAKLDKKTNEVSITLKPLERRMIHTGLYFKLPKYTEMQVRPRSGFAIKEGLSLINAVATIDSNFRGEVCILAVNLSNKNIVIKSGERIAQGILCPVYNSYLVNLTNVENISEDTDRGANGYGSSGKN